MAQTSSAPTQWPVAKLKRHPRQSAFFVDLSDSELAALAADMSAHGQVHPVEITSKGVIITGHQRVRAAVLLGWKTVEVVIRRDLEKAGARAVERRMISDNLVRRQLTVLARARSIVRLVEIELGRAPGDHGFRTIDKIKAAIGAQFGLTPRSISRYLLLLRSPLAIQNSFDDGEITLTQAGRIALLPADIREHVAQRIQNGEKAADVVVEVLPCSSKGSSADAALARFIQSVRREMPIIAGQFESITSGHLERHREFLQTTANFINLMVLQAGAGGNCTANGQRVPGASQD